MDLVVDTNIVFSAVLNSSGKIGEILLHPDALIRFWGCSFLKEELLEHHEKLKKVSGLSDAVLWKSKELILSKITFIDSRLLPMQTLLQAETLVADIDPDDTEHIALALYLQCQFWSGDKKLRQGLINKGVEWIWDTDEVMDALLKLKA